jgi:cellulose synthase/poly-beta-1,6-N-acetylglucosamine synthase-like glycosyltransferase
MIAGTLHSLLACRGADIIVVADNCTDKTAMIAAQLGVRVIERQDPASRGKPYALKYALDIVMPEGYPYFAFVDADTDVDPSFAEVIIAEFNAGADGIQVRYLQRKEHISLRQRLMAIAFNAYNTIRPSGRAYWGLSCGILGNGFALSRHTLEAVPFCVDSIVEDLAYHIEMVRAGLKMRYTEKTTVWTHVPASAKGAVTQRSRWMGGRLRMVVKKGPSLLKEVFQGRFRLIEPLLDLLSPPLAFYAVLLIGLFLIPSANAQKVSLTGAAALVFYMLTALAQQKGGWRDWAAMALAPLYILWALAMIPKIIVNCSHAVWERTERNKEGT